MDVARMVTGEDGHSLSQEEVGEKKKTEEGQREYLVKQLLLSPFWCIRAGA